MKIGVLEWDISTLGGRHRTMLAFADYAVALGHEVAFYSSFNNPRPGYTEDTCLDWFQCSHLQREHLKFGPLHRRYDASTVPLAWHSLDVLIVPYGGYGHLQGLLPGVRVIPWVIHPEQARASSVREVWTNSETTRRRLVESDRWADSNPRIVVPPHDYSLFRQHAKPWDERDIDVLAVGSFLRAKGLVEFSAMVDLLGLRGAVAGTAWGRAAEENAEVQAELADGPCEVHSNLPGDEVARLMGRAKTLVSFSRAESCPLVYYEAMNAGCRVLSLDVGAAREQVGAVGMVATSDEHLVRLVASVQGQVPIESPQERGLLFDRINCGGNVQQALRNE